MAKEPELKIDTAEAKTVENEKVKQQQQDAEAIKEKMNEEKEKAKSASTSSTPKKKKEEKNDNYEALLAVGNSIAKELKKSNKRAKGFGKGLLIGVILGAILMSLFTHFTKNTLFGAVEEGKDTIDQLIEHTFFGYTAQDFEEVVMGAASENAELIVMEQPMQVTTTVTKAGLANLDIFKKMKTLTYYGTGLFTVDLTKVDGNCITVDNQEKKVIIKIPLPTLKTVTPELDRTEFEDTEKGLLAFGDLKLTSEQVNEIETSVVNTMKERCNQYDVVAQSHEFAKLKTWEIFQPLISKVSPEYIVEIEFQE